jgi:hypothetical protein
VKITKQPVSQTVDQGQVVLFTAEADLAPLAWVWRWYPAAGALFPQVYATQTGVFTIAGAQPENEGVYTAEAVWESGSAVSEPATLCVLPASAPKQPPAAFVPSQAQTRFDRSAQGELEQEGCEPDPSERPEGE